MESTNVLIIGGSAGGIVLGVTGKSHYPDKEFMLIRKEKQVVIPCGIPYIFGSLKSSDENIIPDSVLSKAGVKFKIDEAISIDQENKICKTADGTDVKYEKLVFATGSIAVVPKWLKGTDLENVFTINKDKEYLDRVIAKLNNCKKIITVGGGFIGVEVSDELNKLGKEVTIIEILPHILGLAFDEDIAVKAEEIIKSRGIRIRTGVGVKEILGNKNVTHVLLNNGEKIATDAVILSMGYRPNTALADRSGIKLNEMGFIKVNEYMRTDNPDVFAVGDCAEKREFLTRRLSSIMLASTGCAEARTAGMNLYKLHAVKTFNGTIAIFSTAIGETGFGAVGLTENMARREGFDAVTGAFEGIDKHPGKLSDTHKQIVKIIAARDSGLILGAEVIGGPSTGELVNLIGLAIQNKMTIHSILTTQIGTHPLLTASPIVYPIIKAAESFAKKVKTV